MRRARAAIGVGAVVFAVLSVGPATAYQRPGVRTQLDLNSSGHESAAGVVGSTALSGDGRYVAFDSDASDLVPGDNNQAADIFVRDTVTHKLELISRGTNGLPGVGASGCLATGLCYGSPSRFLPTGPPNPNYGAWDPSMSRDGRYVAFASNDANLVAGNRNPGTTNIYVYDRRTARMTLVSVTPKGTPADGSSFLPSISASGRYVSFTSDATNLVTGDSNLIPDVFVRDLLAGKTTRVSVGTGNVEACAGLACATPVAASLGLLVGPAYPESSISGDGRFVEFSDAACNLVANDTNCTLGVPEVFVHDLKLRTTVRISVNTSGGQATYPPPDNAGFVGALGYAGSTLAGPNNPQTFAAGSTISNDGRYAVFTSSAIDLVPNDPGWNPANPYLSGVGIYVRDLHTARTYRVDVQSDGQPVHGHAVNGTYDEEDLYPSISADGRYVAMYCSNCVSVKPLSNLMMYDRVTGEAQSIPCPAGGKRSGSPAGAWNCDWSPQVSADGRHVSFTTYWTPTTPVANFSGAADAFTWDRGAARATDGLVTSGKLTLRDSPAFAASGVVSATGASSPDVLGADLIDATLAYQSTERDLFVREQVQTMPSVAGTPIGSGVVYGFDLTASGHRYEVRVQSGLTSFALFRDDNGRWDQVATLPGGFGTTGTEVVFSIPLADVGLRYGGTLSAVRAFTALPAPSGETAITLDTILLGS